MFEFTNVDMEVTKILYEQFCIGNTKNLEYGELSSHIKNRIGVVVNPHFGLSSSLGKVINICVYLNLPVLSAKIVYKDTQFPGPGFRKEVVKSGYRPEYAKMDDKEAARNEWRLIRECKDWTPLHKFIEGTSLENIKPAKSVPILPLVEQEKTSADRLSPNHEHQDTTHLDEAKEELYVEGELEVGTYENRSRNSKARMKCIELNGTTCVACKRNLGEIYGEEFSDKIHVHHVNPVANYEGEITINPKEDLVPVCPNCHYIIHSRKEPYKIEEIEAFIEHAKENEEYQETVKV